MLTVSPPVEEVAPISDPRPPGTDGDTLEGPAMESGLAPSEPAEDDVPHMGSEYVNAQTFLTREPRVTVGQVKKKKEPLKDPEHGSNDSDFGFADQHPD